MSPKPHRRTSPLGKILRRGLLTLALVLAADAIYVGLQLARSLVEVADELRAARVAFASGDVRGAMDHLNASDRATKQASGLTLHPAFFVGQILPDVRVLRGFVLMAQHVVDGGHAGVEAAEGLGLKEEGLAASVYSEGHLQLRALNASIPPLLKVESSFRDAAGALESVPRPLWGLLREAVTTTREELGGIASGVHDVNVLFHVLPRMLGETETREYLLVFQALGEARATGGLIGFYGILKSADGRLRLTELAPIEELTKRLRGSVAAPEEWFGEAYRSQSALSEIQQANVSPNFPVVSEVLLRMYASVRERELDGVLSMDPISLQYLMAGTGPLVSQGRVVAPEEAADAIMRRSYLEFTDTGEQNLFIAGLIRAFWEKVKVGAVDVPALAQGLTKSVRTTHFKVYSRPSAEQAAMTELEAAGDFAAFGPNVQMIFHNNYAVNKVDYFLERKVDTSVNLTSQGDAEVSTTVVVRNTTPPRQRSILAGPGLRGDPAGLNRMMINFLLPQDSNLVTYTSPEKQGGLPNYSDADSPVFWDLVEIPAGKAVTLNLSYVVENAVARLSGGSFFELMLYPQPTPTPDSFTVSVRAPRGFVLHDPTAPFASGMATYSNSGTLDRPRIISLELRPT